MQVNLGGMRSKIMFRTHYLHGGFPRSCIVSHISDISPLTGGQDPVKGEQRMLTRKCFPWGQARTEVTL